MATKAPPPYEPPLKNWSTPKRGQNIYHQQFNCPWPQPRHNGTKSIKVQWHAFLMVKMSWNTENIQFPMGKWIHQPCRLPNKSERPSTSHTLELKICSTNQNKQFTNPPRKIYTLGDIPTRWNARPFLKSFFISLHFYNIFCDNY